MGVVDDLANDRDTQTHALTMALKGWYATKASRGHRIVHRRTDDGGIHVGYVGLHEYDKAIRRLTSLDRKPGPVSFPYARRRGSSKGYGDFGSRFGQDIEPHGRYMTMKQTPGNYPEDMWETGEASFENPLHLDFGGEYGDETNWKNRLSAQYGGKKGKSLSRALLKDGYDGIITHDEYGPSEIVDLTPLQRKASTPTKSESHDPTHGWPKHQRATSLAQEQARIEHPSLTRTVDEEEGTRFLREVLRKAGHPGHEDAFCVIHNGTRSSSNTAVSQETGAIGVSLHPSRADYGTLAHEAAHLLHDRQTGRRFGEAREDHEVHGIGFVNHYARVLDENFGEKTPGGNWKGGPGQTLLNEYYSTLAPIGKTSAKRDTMYVGPYHSSLYYDDLGDFRRVLYTSPKSQLVLMTLRPGEDIGEEVHDVDQTIMLRSGRGVVDLDGNKQVFGGEDVVCIPAGVRHNIINSEDGPMTLATVYAPAHHAPGTIHHTKADAKADKGEEFKPVKTAATDDCSCCGGAGEHITGHECYRCDSSGKPDADERRQPWCDEVFRDLAAHAERCPHCGPQKVAKRRPKLKVSERGQLSMEAMKQSPGKGPLPIEPEKTWYRLHYRPRSWGDATSAEITPYSGSTKREEYTRAPGFSAMGDPHDLDRYLDEMGWYSHIDKIDPEHKNHTIVQFPGERTGRTGSNGEPLVKPGPRADRIEMPIEEFHRRLDETPYGDEPGSYNQQVTQPRKDMIEHLQARHPETQSFDDAHFHGRLTPWSIHDLLHEHTDVEHSHEGLAMSDPFAYWLKGRKKTSKRRPKLKSRIFGPSKGSLDPRLFEGDHMRPEVRTAVLSRLGPVLEPFLGPDWQKVTRVYLAGSESSEWYGNNDFDTLVGVDFDHLGREPGIPAAGLDEDHVREMLNAALRVGYNASDWWVLVKSDAWHHPESFNLKSNENSPNVTSARTSRPMPSPRSMASLTKSSLTPSSGLEYFGPAPAERFLKIDSFDSSSSTETNPSPSLISPRTQGFQSRLSAGPSGSLESRSMPLARGGDGSSDARSSVELASKNDPFKEAGARTALGSTTTGTTLSGPWGSRTSGTRNSSVLDAPSADALMSYFTWTTTTPAALGERRVASASGDFSVNGTIEGSAPSASSTSSPQWIISPEPPESAPDGYDWAGPFDVTGYVNKNGYDIRKIKPYAAYDITRDEWAVKPPHLPDWDFTQHPLYKPLLAEMKGYADAIEAIDAMPEPHRTQQGRALWEHLHSDRARAFSDEGSGWDDPGNLVEKALVEWGLWDKLVGIRYGQQKTASYPGWGHAKGTMDPADLSRTTPAVVYHQGEDETDRDIEANGVTNPIDVRRQGGKNWIIDGHHRHRKAMELGLSEVPVYVRYPEQEGPPPSLRNAESIPWYEYEHGPGRVGHFPNYREYYGGEQKTASRPEVEFKTTKGRRKGIRHTTISAHVDDRKVGHVRMISEDSEVDDLHVTPDMRGKGIAHALMNEAIDRFGHQTLRLHASPFGKGGLGSEDLQAFYVSHGFEPEEARGKGYMVRRPIQSEAQIKSLSVKGSDHPLAPDLPQEQHDALTAEPMSVHKRKLLELAKNPVPGVHMWRGEVRKGDPIQGARETGVGIHWGLNPDTIVRPPAYGDDEHEVVYHAELEHPGDQNFDRSHPMWGGSHRSLDSEAEVRMKPGGKVKLHGVWVRDPHHSDPGYFVPRVPERMGGQWTYHPIGEHVPVAHRPSSDVIDYTDVGVRHEGVLEYFTAAEEDDTNYRMQHRPPDTDFGAPLHDIGEDVMPDLYRHPEYYDHSGEPSYWDSFAQVSRTRGKPDAKVKIYRSLPAEHAHQGFRPGDWVTTSKEYAVNHGKQEDPKHDWPVISTTVPAKHLQTDGNDLREWGYTGPHKDMPMVSFKGGYHQEIRHDSEGWIKPVKRRKPKTASDYRLQHRAPNEDSGKPYHEYFGGHEDDPVRIYRAAPHDVDYLDSDTWVTTNPDYAHLHAEQYDGSKKWPVMSAEVPAKHVYWDENDGNEFGYQGPRLEENHLEEHDQEHGLKPFESQVPQRTPVRKKRPQQQWGVGIAHLTPQEHGESLLHLDRPVALKAVDQALSGVKWDHSGNQVESQVAERLQAARGHGPQGTRPVGVIMRSQNGKVDRVALRHHHEDLDPDHLFAGIEIHRSGAFHDLEGDARPVGKTAGLIDYFGMAA